MGLALEAVKQADRLQELSPSLSLAGLAEMQQQTLAQVAAEAVVCSSLQQARQPITHQQSLQRRRLVAMAEQGGCMSSTPLSGYAFVNAEMVVVNAIGGELNAMQLERFERDYAILFDAKLSVPVYDGTVVFIGGRYNPDTGEFTQPEPAPQPLPEDTEPA